MVGFYIFIIILIMIGVPIIFFVLLNSGFKAHHRKKLETWHENGIEYQVSLYHVGGHPYLNAKSNITIVLGKNGNIDFLNNHKELVNSINISQITSYEMKDETQMRSRITATRLVAFGIFAAVAPKKTTTRTYYLTFSYTQNGINIDCLFHSMIPFGEFVSAINRLRIENAL